VPQLLRHDTAGEFTGLTVVAGIVAGVTAYLSIAFLMGYFKRHDFESLDPFAWYCWAAGVLALVLLYIGA
jgi:undecaprenyl-diphosphatase